MQGIYEDTICMLLNVYHENNIHTHIANSSQVLLFVAIFVILSLVSLCIPIYNK